MGLMTYLAVLFAFLSAMLAANIVVRLGKVEQDIQAIKEHLKVPGEKDPEKIDA